MGKITRQELSENLNNEIDVIQEDIGTLDSNLNLVDNTVAAHLAESATQTKLGHIKLPENWIVATPINEWVNQGMPFGATGYYKDNFGVVHLRGMIKDGKASWEAMFLAVGYRTSSEKSFPVSSNKENAKINITTNGAIVPTVGGVGTWVSLDGVSFRL